MCRSMSICTLMFVICSWLFSIPESTTDLSSPRAAQICRQNRHPTTTECRDTFCHQDTFFAYLPSDFWRRCHAHHEINFSSVRNAYYYTHARAALTCAFDYLPFPFGCVFFRALSHTAVGGIFQIVIFSIPTVYFFDLMVSIVSRAALLTIETIKSKK